MLAMWLLVGGLLRHWQRRGRNGSGRIVKAWGLTSALPGSALLLLPWKRTRQLLVPSAAATSLESGALPSRGARAFEIVVGVLAVAAGGIWMLFRFALAALVWGDFLGDNPASADLAVSLILALGLLPVGFGVAMLLGPRRRRALRRRCGRAEGRAGAGGARDATAGRIAAPDGGSLRRGGRIAIIVVLLVAALIAIGSFGDGQDGSDDGSRVEDGSMTMSWSDNLPLYSPDGGWVAVVGFHDGRWAVSAGPVGAEAKWITSSAHGDGGAAWSPDGSRLVFFRLTKDSFELGVDWGTPLWRESEGLYIVNRDGSDMSRLTDGDDVSPCWSADGETIVFERWADSDPSGVYAVAADGGEPRLLARPGANPACSPSGSTVAYEDGTDTIRTLDLANGIRRVLAVREAASTPAWAPDGTRVAFYAVAGPGHWDSRWDIPVERLEIYLVNADGTELRRLTRNVNLDAAPVWTRDGRIVFKTFRPGGLRVYVMNSDGSGVRPFPARLSAAD
jgi:TolB protein